MTLQKKLLVHQNENFSIPQTNEVADGKICFIKEPNILHRFCQQLTVHLVFVKILHALIITLSLVNLNPVLKQTKAVEKRH